MSRPLTNRVCALLALTLGCWGGVSGRAQETNSTGPEASISAEDPFAREQVRHQAAEAQERYRLRLVIPETNEEVVALAPSSKEASNSPGAAGPAGRGQALWRVVLSGSVGLIALWGIARGTTRTVSRGRSPDAAALGESMAPSLEDSPEEQAFAAFVAGFRVGPRANKQSEPECDSWDGLFEEAHEQLRGARKLLQELTHTTQTAGLHDVLVDFCDRMRRLKEGAEEPELLPLWQMATTFESLLKQLSAQPSKLTPSVLRTMAAGLEVLDGLCHPELEARAGAYAAPHFLVVDDNAFSRHAVALALKKAFSQPDMAPDGKRALALAGSRAYDAIFLDVLMPEMDGFELCTKIHEIPLNRNTPVVFITMQNDFEARTKSVLCGGTDLLGKPFQTFELTLKALTLTLRARMKGGRKHSQEATASMTGPLSAEIPADDLPAGSPPTSPAAPEAAAVGS